MKKNKPLLIFTIISVLVLITSLFGLNKFEESVDAEDGLLKQYKYSEGSTDDCVEVTVEATESWVKLIPNDFVIDEHFKHNKFDKKNENDERGKYFECAAIKSFFKELRHCRRV